MPSQGVFDRWGIGEAVGEENRWGTVLLAYQALDQLHHPEGERNREMPIEHVNLREKLYQVRLSFDTQLAEVLQKRPDLTQAQIKQQFGVSDTVIRRVMKQFDIGPRRGGRKPTQQPTAECP